MDNASENKAVAAQLHKSSVSPVSVDASEARKPGEPPLYSVRQLALRTTAIYAVVAALWIAFTDPLLSWLVSDHELLVKLQMVKGWAFVVVTALMLWILLQRETRHWTAERRAREAAEVERRQADEALRQSQAQTAFYAKMVEQSAQPFVSGFADGRLGQFNTAYAAMMGYPAEELRTLNWERQLTPVEWLDHENEKLAELIRTGQPIRYEKECFRKDGTRFPVEVFCHLGRDELGPFCYYYAFISDITERKRAESDIRQLNRVYAVLLDINQIIVRERDLQVVFSKACGIAVEKGGFALTWIGLVDEATGKEKITAQAGDTPEVMRALEAVIESALCNDTAEVLKSGCHSVCNDIAHNPKAAAWRETALRFGYRSVAVFPLKTAGRTFGTFNFYAGEADFFDADELHLLDELAADISFAVELSQRETKRKQTEASLRESTERFHQLAGSIDDVFWMTGVDNNDKVFISPAYERIWGRSCESWYANPGSWLEAIDPADRERIKIAEATKQLEGKYAETYRIHRPDGQVRWIEDRAFPVRDEAGNVYRIVGIAADITEYRTLEDQFRQAQKMEAIGTLAGGIAHDFNNILGAILGYTELAKLEGGTNKAQDSLDEVLSACRRAGDLVRQILAFSRQQENKRAPLCLWRVVHEAMKLLRAVLPSTIEFRIDLEQNAPAVLADPTQIHQVVMNLCTNAAQAMAGRAGLLSVRLAALHADEAFMKKHPGGQPGRYVCLTVSDNGTGITPAAMERIFEPFFTTKAPGEGTGLGLAVVHGIVQKHDGIITVESEPGQGATFRLYFPAHDTMTKETAAPVDTFIQGGGQSILVVDDEKPLVQMVGQILNKLGYIADPRHEPAEALAALRAAPQLYDMLITDLTMPGMTGLAVSAEAVRLNPRIKVILMTGFYANLTDEQVQRAGISEVLLKPVGVKGLSETVSRVLNSKTQN